MTNIHLKRKPIVPTVWRDPHSGLRQIALKQSQVAKDYIKEVADHADKWLAAVQGFKGQYELKDIDALEQLLQDVVELPFSDMMKAIDEGGAELKKAKKSELFEVVESQKDRCWQIHKEVKSIYSELLSKAIEVTDQLACADTETLQQYKASENYRGYCMQTLETLYSADDRCFNNLMTLSRDIHKAKMQTYSAGDKGSSIS